MSLIRFEHPTVIASFPFLKREDVSDAILELEHAREVLPRGVDFVKACNSLYSYYVCDNLSESQGAYGVRAWIRAQLGGRFGLLEWLIEQGEDLEDDHSALSDREFMSLQDARLRWVQAMIDYLEEGQS